MDSKKILRDFLVWLLLCALINSICYNNIIRILRNVYFCYKNFNYKNKHTEMKYLSNIWKNRILKVTGSLLELETNFKKPKDRELKVRETANRKEVKKLFFKIINVSIEDAKNTSYGLCDWLTNHISKAIKIRWVMFKTKLWLFLKHTQTRMIVNQHEKRPRKLITKNNPRTTKLKI